MWMITQLLLQFVADFFRPRPADGEPPSEGSNQAYHRVGQFSDAGEICRRVRRINSNHLLARYHLAKTYEGVELLTGVFDQYQHFSELWSRADRDLPPIIDADERIEGLRAQGIVPVRVPTGTRTIWPKELWDEELDGVSVDKECTDCFC